MWALLNRYQRIKAIKVLYSKGFTKIEIANRLFCDASSITNFCKNYLKIEWKRGGREGNKNAGPGNGKHAIRRKTQEIVIKSGRSLRICERCKSINKWQNWSIHHKDENRSNNIDNNLEVLCNTCHATVHIKTRNRNNLGRIT